MFKMLTISNIFGPNINTRLSLSDIFRKQCLIIVWKSFIYTTNKRFLEELPLRYLEDLQLFTNSDTNNYEISLKRYPQLQRNVAFLHC